MEQKPHQQQAREFGNAMNNIAYGQTMMAAIRDYQKGLGNEPETSSSGQQALNVEELFDDPELQKVHADRLAQMQRDKEQRVEKSRKGHGSYQEITEGDFLEVATKSEKLVCHFFHKDFERCKILDKHFEILARKYFDTRFVKLSAEEAPFFVIKLNIKILPAILIFINGQAVDRVVGFESLGARDDFPTSVLEDRLVCVGAIHFNQPTLEDGEEAPHVSKVKKGGRFEKTESDEDSDFGDDS